MDDEERMKKSARHMKVKNCSICKKVFAVLKEWDDVLICPRCLEEKLRAKDKEIEEWKKRFQLDQKEIEELKGKVVSVGLTYRDLLEELEVERAKVLKLEKEVEDYEEDLSQRDRDFENMMGERNLLHRENEKYEEVLKKVMEDKKALEVNVKEAEEFIIKLGHEDSYRLWSMKRKSVSDILPHTDKPKEKVMAFSPLMVAPEEKETKEPVEGIVYHWTDTKTAEKILKGGLHKNSFVCRYPHEWKGEVCLAIEYEIDWEGRDPDATWQAIVKEHIPPEKIHLHDPEPDDKTCSKCGHNKHKGKCGVMDDGITSCDCKGE